MAVDRAHRQRFVAGFREPGSDTGKAGARAVCPECFAAFGRGKQHRCDLLQLDDHVVGVAAVDIGERVIARGASLPRSEENTSELQSLMRISYAAFGLKKKTETH